MKKICNIINLIPIAFITLIFLSEEEMKIHCKSQCISLLALFIIFCLMYYLIFCANCNRYIVSFIGFILWIIISVTKNKVLK